MRGCGMRRGQLTESVKALELAGRLQFCTGDERPNGRGSIRRGADERRARVDRREPRAARRNVRRRTLRRHTCHTLVSHLRHPLNGEEKDAPDTPSSQKLGTDPLGKSRNSISPW